MQLHVCVCSVQCKLSWLCLCADLLQFVNMNGCWVFIRFLYVSQGMAKNTWLFHENRYNILFENQMTSKRAHINTKRTNQMVKAKAKANGGSFYSLFSFSLPTNCNHNLFACLSDSWHSVKYLLRVFFFAVDVALFFDSFSFCFLSFSGESNDRYERISISLNRFLLPFSLISFSANLFWIW